MGIEKLVEGGTYDVRLNARNPRGEGIGKIEDVVVFVKDANARIGKIHKIKITKLYRTFAYGEVVDQLNNSKYFINSGSIIL